MQDGMRENKLSSTYKFPGNAVFIFCDLLRCSHSNDPSACFAAFRTHIDDIIWRFGSHPDRVLSQSQLPPDPQVPGIPEAASLRPMDVIQSSVHRTRKRNQTALSPSHWQVSVSVLPHRTVPVSPLPGSDSQAQDLAVLPAAAAPLSSLLPPVVLCLHPSPSSAATNTFSPVPFHSKPAMPLSHTEILYIPDTPHLHPAKTVHPV